MDSFEEEKCDGDLMNVSLDGLEDDEELLVTDVTKNDNEATFWTVRDIRHKRKQRRGRSANPRPRSKAVDVSFDLERSWNRGKGDSLHSCVGGKVRAHLFLHHQAGKQPDHIDVRLNCRGENSHQRLQRDVSVTCGGFF